MGIPHPTGGYDDVQIGTEYSVSGLDAVNAEVTSYLRAGFLHRLDGPAVIAERGGEPLDEEWRVMGYLHRVDGPAYTVYEHGVPMWEAWLVDGKSHRLDGPARIGRKRPTAPPREEFFVQDEALTAEEHSRVVEALRDGAPFEWALAYARGHEG